MKSRLKIYSLLGALCVMHCGVPYLYSYPSEYQRLIKIDNAGRIEKVVDLISDIHIPSFVHPRGELKSMSISENDYYKVSDDLLQYFETLLQKQEQPITILLEASLNEAEDELLALGLIKDLAFRFRPFKGSGNRVSIVGVDTYRKVHGVQSLVALIPAPFLFPLLRQGLESWFMNIDKILYEDTSSLPDVFIRGQIQRMWDHAFSQFKNDCFNRLTLSVHSCVFKFYNQTIGDFQLLIHIFKTRDSHVIAYYGGLHCQEVAEILKKEFGFKTYVHVGTAPEIAAQYMIMNIHLSLLHTAWEFLQEDPQTSYERGPYIHFSTANPFSECKNIQDFKNNFEKILAHGKQHHTNVLHMEIYGKTLLEHLMDLGAIEEINKALRAAHEASSYK